jgi:hypothetical protein
MKMAKLFLAVILATALSAPAMAMSKDAQNDFGVKIGVVLPGTWDSDYGSADSDAGLGLGVFGDMRVAERIFFGAFLDYTSLSISDVDYSGSELDLGVALKFQLDTPELPMILRPSLGFAYGTTTSDGDVDSASLFVINLSIEAISANTDGLSYFGEFGFTAVPAGGNDDSDLTHSPIFFLKGGLIF